MKMALYKNLMTPRGRCEFWIIGAYWIDNFAKTAFVTIYGFENKEHCDAEGSVFKEKLSYSINNINGDFEKYLNPKQLQKKNINPSTQFYKYIKDNDENFIGSEDWIY